MDKRTSYKWQFIGSLFVVSTVAIIGFGLLSISYHNRLIYVEADFIKEAWDAGQHWEE